MTKIEKLQSKKKTIVLIQKQQAKLKGGGLGNFHRKEGKKCPPPFEG